MVSDTYMSHYYILKIVTGSSCFLFLSFRWENETLEIMQLVQSHELEARKPEFQSWLLASKPEGLNIMMLPETSTGLLLGQSLSQLCQGILVVTLGKFSFSPLTITLGLWILRPLPVNPHLVLQPGLHPSNSITTGLQPWTICPAVSVLQSQ